MLTGCQEGTYTVEVNTEGEGRVVRMPDNSIYKENTIVELTTEAAEGWEFDYWEGSGFKGNENESITLTMDGNYYLNAIFKEKMQTVRDTKNYLYLSSVLFQYILKVL